MQAVAADQLAAADREKQERYRQFVLQYQATVQQMSSAAPAKVESAKPEVPVIKPEPDLVPEDGAAEEFVFEDAFPAKAGKGAWSYAVVLAL